MSAYELSAPARLDVLKIWNYIAENNIDAADRVISDLRAAMEQLAEFPGLGHHRPDVAEGYRCWRVYSFIIVYRPDTKPLGIVRVVHGHRDFRELFPEEWVTPAESRKQHHPRTSRSGGGVVLD